jgi:hypothetical protein
VQRTVARQNSNKCCSKQLSSAVAKTDSNIAEVEAIKLKSKLKKILQQPTKNKTKLKPFTKKYEQYKVLSQRSISSKPYN